MMLRRVLAFFGLAWKKDLDEYKEFCAEAVAATFEAQEIAFEAQKTVREMREMVGVILLSTTENTPRQ